MAEPQTGMRGTKYADGTETSLKRDVADKINLLNPDAAPLLALMNALKRKKVATEAKYEWFEDTLRPNTVADASGAGTGTTLNVATGTGVRVRPGDILIAPNGESIMVTSIATDALTVVRSKGAVAAYSSVTGTEFVIVGQAQAEGSAITTARWTAKVPKKNYIQIFEDVVHLTDVQSMVQSFGPNDRKHQRMKTAIEHKRSIEQAYLFGDAFEDTGGAQTVRGTGGILNSITSNITDIGGVLTEPDFEAFLRTCFRHPATTNGDGSKTLLMSAILCSAINFWAKSALVIEPNTKVYGVKMGKYVTGHGVLNLINHWLLNDFTEFQKYGIVVEQSNVQERHLEGGDTKLEVDVQNPSDKIKLDRYTSYKGMQTEQEITHGIIKGITGFAA